MFRQILNNIFKHSRFHSHNIMHIVDKSYFKIKSDIFVQMTCRVVFFGSVNRSNFKHSVKECYASLFVELRTLCKICVFIKVFQFEYISTALSTCRNDLGECISVKLLFNINSRNADTTPSAILNTALCSG